MTENKRMPKITIDYGKLIRDLLKHTRLFCIVLPVSFVVALLVMLSIPNYYTCTVKLSPELSGRSSSTSGLASLASSFGFKLGSNIGSGSEALFPTLYPDMMASVDFKTSLFNVKVKSEEIGGEYSYYDYLKNHKKKPWWSKLKKSIIDLIKSDSSEAMSINPRRLTKEQNDMALSLSNFVTCQVDRKTMVITISVTDTDPEVCTIMADSTMALLQSYITDYRTSKARVDLDYNKKLLAEAKKNYEHASQAYARYADANLHTFQERISQKKSEMETEVALQRTVYQQVAAQLQQAEMKLQEDTPAFAVIQASTVPAKKSGPSRAINSLLFVFLALFGTAIYVLYKEGHFIKIPNV